mmetsp:Transcript_1728/g.3759  ORF Transcript_1728/g.3759 Transcript_1728/m.3759 type:complete len:254 (+) Transcript_1728:1274-2035(+)
MMPHAERSSCGMQHLVVRPLHWPLCWKPLEQSLDSLHSPPMAVQPGFGSTSLYALALGEVPPRHCVHLAQRPARWSMPLRPPLMRLDIQKKLSHESSAYWPRFLLIFQNHMVVRKPYSRSATLCGYLTMLSESLAESRLLARSHLYASRKLDRCVSWIGPRPLYVHPPSYLAQSAALTISVHQRSEPDSAPTCARNCAISERLVIPKDLSALLSSARYVRSRLSEKPKARYSMQHLSCSLVTPSGRSRESPGG